MMGLEAGCVEMDCFPECFEGLMRWRVLFIVLGENKTRIVVIYPFRMRFRW